MVEELVHLPRLAKKCLDGWTLDEYSKSHQTSKVCCMIDRISPTIRPMRDPCGWQQWRNLLFMHWRAPVDLVRKVIPQQLDLDLFGNQAYVGIVPFEMQGVRPWRWWPRKMAFSFKKRKL